MKTLKIIFYIFLVVLLFNGCAKEYSLEGLGVRVPAGTWEFKDSLTSFQGNIDSAYFVSSAGSATKELHLLGKSQDGSQTFDMYLFADTFKTGIYKASLFQCAFEYSMPANALYQDYQLIGEFIVNITSFSNTSISGTFSGAALDSGNNVKNLSPGKFTSRIGVSGPLSSGVLGDSAGNCKPVVVAGIYTPGVALTPVNTVQVRVTVAVAGDYLITTNRVNGIAFSKSGTFTSTGDQTVTLNGTGTPLNSGAQNYTVRFGNSSCTFSID